MKIVILGLIAVALVNVAVAAPSDKGEKDDTILEQMKDLRDQLRQQKEQQNLINRLMEEQQEQLKVQQRRDEEQQNKMEEVTKIQRTRRSENETVHHLRELILAELKPLSVEHIKELVLSEIKPMIDVLSECAIGNYTLQGKGRGGLRETTTISFGRTFSRKPKVIASAANRYISLEGTLGTMRMLRATVNSPTTTKFNLEIVVESVYYVSWIEFIWIACA